jgi:hypothetical protein
MRKLLIYIVLIMHVNTYMFFPMIDEQDVFDSAGVQKDDINSLAEYIYQVVLGHKDDTPEDEDDDQAHFYHFKSRCNLIVQYMVVQSVKEQALVITESSVYGMSHVPQLLHPSYDISAPPPDA